jgi:hypothetical protein
MVSIGYSDMRVLRPWFIGRLRIVSLSFERKIGG